MYMTKKGEIQCDAEGRPVPKTSHSLNPVPFVVYDPRGRYAIAAGVDKPGLGNNASTIINLLGYEAPKNYLPSLVVPR
jgi:2,3-bisphosphoglycerate-independent phosphoglycerate mutase